MTSREVCIEIGFSNFHIVSLGDNAAGLPKRGGFGYERFFVSELVCVARSNGQNSIAQIKKLCPEFAIVELGNGLEKQISGIDIPVFFSKLIDSYCLKRFAVQLPGGTPDSLLEILTAYFSGTKLQRHTTKEWISVRLLLCWRSDCSALF